MLAPTPGFGELERARVRTRRSDWEIEQEHFPYAFGVGTRTRTSRSGFGDAPHTPTHCAFGKTLRAARSRAGRERENAARIACVEKRRTRSTRLKSSAPMKSVMRNAKRGAGNAKRTPRGARPLRLRVRRTEALWPLRVRETPKPHNAGNLSSPPFADEITVEENKSCRSLAWARGFGVSDERFCSGRKKSSAIIGLSHQTKPTVGSLPSSHRRQKRGQT